MNKLFLPVCLLVAGSASALSDTFKSLLAQEATKTKCERLSTEQKAALDNYLSKLEAKARALSHEANQSLLDLSLEEEEGAEAFKEVMGADQIVSQVMLIPVPMKSAPVVDFMEDEDDIFDDADDVRMVS